MEPAAMAEWLRSPTGCDYYIYQYFLKMMSTDLAKLLTRYNKEKASNRKSLQIIKNQLRHNFRSVHSTTYDWEGQLCKSIHYIFKLIAHHPKRIFPEMLV